MEEGRHGSDLQGPPSSSTAHPARRFLSPVNAGSSGHWEARATTAAETWSRDPSPTSPRSRSRPLGARLRAPRRTLGLLGGRPSRRLAEQVQMPAGEEPSPNHVQRLSRPLERRDLDGEDLVVALVPEIRLLESGGDEPRLARMGLVSLCAIAIILGERSTPVIRPPSRRSHTSATATPCPHPTSRMRSSGATSRTSNRPERPG